jgi:hypothetical protein
MPAKKKNCEGCGKRFWASRSDAKYCKERCRYKIRAEDARFAVPRLPRSGVEGVTYSRLRKRWEVRIREGDGWKYIGTERELRDAIALQERVLGGSTGCLTRAVLLC